VRKNKSDFESQRGCWEKSGTGEISRALAQSGYSLGEGARLVDALYWIS
jgi:hypothetical protein